MDEVTHESIKSVAELAVCATCGHRAWLHEGRRPLCVMAGCHRCEGFEAAEEAVTV